MSRYIDADMLKANCDIVVGNTTTGRRDYVMFHEIDSAPSIDIVKCKDCVAYICGICECDSIYMQMRGDLIGVTFEPSEDFYCGFGIRKEDRP